MSESVHAEEKREPLHKRFAALLWRERRTCFWSAIAAVPLSVAVTIMLRRKLMALLVAALAGLAHGCQETLDGLKDLH
jgi:hypothetical protein